MKGKKNHELQEEKSEFRDAEFYLFCTSMGGVTRKRERERERERISGAREDKVSNCSPNFLLPGFCCVTKIYWLTKKLFILIKCAA